MAKTIATVSGVAIRPGVSANRRLYTAPVIAAMVSAAQSAIESGADLSMLTHHGAEDASDRIVGRIRSMSLDEDGSARFTADLADTQHGRTVASLLDTSDGKPAFLKGVSIRGFWKGTVRKVRGPDGEDCETGDSLSLSGLDYTKTPGVTGAQVDSFAWTRGGARSETTERIFITESVQEARVTTITEDAGPAPVISEAVLEVFAAGHVLEDGLCATCAPVAEGGSAPGDGSKPYGDVSYADPGYQSDKKKRYPIDSKAHAKAAYSYLSQKSNAGKYTSAQLKRVMGRIKGALKQLGVSVAAESGWLVGEPASVSEAVAEWWPGDYCGSPGTAGSYCLTASNGPTSLTISSCSLDPEDLDPVLRAAADAACKALAALDPDMDGDIDVTGATGDAKPDETADDEETTEAEPSATDTAPATEADGTAAEAAPDEEEAVSDTTTTETAAAPPASVTLTQEQFDALLARTAPAPAVETAPAAPAATEAAPAAAVTETADQRMARLTALAESKVAEAAQKAGLSVTETDEQIMERLIEERLVPLRQAAAEKSGSGTGRKGLLEAIAEQAPGSTKMLQEASGADLAALAAAAYPAPGRR